MFVEVIPNVFVRADCVYRISVTGNIVAVMFNDGTGGQSQTASFTFPNPDAAKKWAADVMLGVLEALRDRLRPASQPPIDSNSSGQPKRK